jgi:hypothetical protein
MNPEKIYERENRPPATRAEFLAGVAIILSLIAILISLLRLLML